MMAHVYTDVDPSPVVFVPHRQWKPHNSKFGFKRKHPSTEHWNEASSSRVLELSSTD